MEDSLCQNGFPVRDTHGEACGVNPFKNNMGAGPENSRVHTSVNVAR